MASALNVFRAEYSRDIAKYIASGGSKQDSNYHAGLLFVACILAGFASIWFFVLLLFKCRGRDVFGCAAGYAVERNGRIRNQDESKPYRPKTYIENKSKDCNSLEFKKDRRRRPIVRVEEAQTKEESGDEVSNQSSIPSVELNESSIDSEAEVSTLIGEVAEPTTRERRIRIAFMFFSLISLVCVPCVVVFSFAPLKSAVTETNQEVNRVKDTVDEVQQSIRKMVSTANSSINIVDALPLNLSILCPTFDHGDNETGLGINMEMLINRVEALRKMEERLEGNISDFKEVLRDVEDGLDSFESSYNQAAMFVWLVPVVLLLLCSLVGLMMFGVILAWRGRASIKLQRFMSCLILPLFVAVTIACWMLAITAAVTTASGSDACMYKSSNETSPDQFFDTLLSSFVDGNSSNVFDAAVTYVHGCDKGKTMSDLMTPFVYQLEDANRFIWSQVALVDSIGQDQLSESCGSLRLNDLVAGALELADSLALMKKLLQRIQSSLSCPSTRRSYVKVVHDSICTDATNAAAAGFLLFLVIGISSLCMISLRSAWRHEIQEEKVLKDSEIAMNMIVDEHEDYLAYISRYKHEWEEYDGIDHKTFDRSRLGLGEAGRKNEELDSISLHDTMSQETPYSQGKRASMFDPYQGSDGDGRSHASTLGEISFPSLHHDDPGELSDDEYLLRQHSMLLQGSLGQINDDENDIDDALAPTTSVDHSILMSQFSLPHAVPSDGHDHDSFVSEGEDYMIDISLTNETGSYRGGKGTESTRNRGLNASRGAPVPRNRLPPASSR